LLGIEIPKILGSGKKKMMEYSQLELLIMHCRSQTWSKTYRYLNTFKVQKYFPQLNTSLEDYCWIEYQQRQT